MTTPHDLFKDYAVTDVKTVPAFLDRYYKYDRYTGRGAEYAAVVLESHETELLESGMTWMSHHESVTGQVVAFYPAEIIE